MLYLDIVVIYTMPSLMIDRVNWHILNFTGIIYMHKNLLNVWKCLIYELLFAYESAGLMAEMPKS